LTRKDFKKHFFFSVSSYNATVLAYGQTGSGKTFTMGTGFELSGISNEQVKTNSPLNLT
jgi:hypothetical protein